MLVDFFGRKFEVGDKIIYPLATSNTGLILGTVTAVSNNNLKVQPAKQSRTYSEYYDNRTGKVINPYSGNGNHILRLGGYPQRPDGSTDYTGGWHATEFKDYVSRRNINSKEVTLAITDRVVIVNDIVAGLDDIIW